MNRNFSDASDHFKTLPASQISDQEVYEKALQAAIIYHRLEPRFTETKAANKNNLSSPSFNKRSSLVSSSKILKWHYDDKNKDKENSQEDLLPRGTFERLMTSLYKITIKETHRHYDPTTRRIMSAFYAKISDKSTYGAMSAGQLVGIFSGVAAAELHLLQKQTPNNEQAATDTYNYVVAFLDLLIEIVKVSSAKEARECVLYLNKLKRQQETGITSRTETARTYITPRFVVSEMHFALLVGKIFNKSEPELQNDIDRLKSRSSEHCLNNDLRLLISSVQKDSGAYCPTDFLPKNGSVDFYKAWKDKEIDSLAKLSAELTTRQQNSQSSSSANGGTNFNSAGLTVIPTDARAYFVKFLERCLNLRGSDPTIKEVLFSNEIGKLISKVSQMWRISDTAKAALLFTAGNNTIINVISYQGTITDIDTEMANLVIAQCLTYVRDLNDDSMYSWPIQDREQWKNCIKECYLQTMGSIRTKLGQILSSERPKFNRHLKFIEFLESDPTFDVTWEKKWKDKFTRTVEQAFYKKYHEMLSNVPKDSSLGIEHVWNLGETIMNLLESISNKFPRPFMNLVDIFKLAVARFCFYFGIDAKNMMKFIIEKRSEALGVDKIEAVSYTDCLKIYQSLASLRDIQRRQLPDEPFKFKLEKFFYPFAEKMVLDAEEKLLTSSRNTLNVDKFEPLSESGCSSSVKDCMELFQAPLKFLESLQWEDPYQKAKLYTLLTKSITEALIEYGKQCLRLLQSDLMVADSSTANGSRDDIEHITRVFKWVAITGLSGSGESNSAANNQKPTRFQFPQRVCVLLNNVVAMLDNLNALENQLVPERISAIVRAREGEPMPSDSVNLFSVKVVRALDLPIKGSDGFSDTYVVLVDSSTRKTVGRTRIIMDDLNPVWNEEFELAVPPGNSGEIIVNVWDNSDKSSTSHKLVGSTKLSLSRDTVSDSGMPTESWKDLLDGGEPQGRILFSVSMESEKLDAVFCFGRAHRTLTRIRDRTVTLMVAQFSKPIFTTFSLRTLQSICGNNGKQKPSTAEIRDAIVPLGEYLNENLAVLATSLSRPLLLKVMLESWNVVLNTADSLLLPPLSVARHLIYESSASMWGSKLKATLAANLGSNSSRPLTQIEVEVVFEWLTILCMEFFYAEGEGVPLEDLKNSHYQRLLWILSDYAQDGHRLMEESQMLASAVDRAIEAKIFYDGGIATTGTNVANLGKSGTIARSGTIMAHSTAKARALAQKEVQQAAHDPLQHKYDRENIFLRILIAKGDKEYIDYVSKRLAEREQVGVSAQTLMKVKAAASGRIVNFKSL